MSSIELTRSIFTPAVRKHFQERYNMWAYQLNALEKANETIDFKGKTILEVGGSNLPRELVIDFLKVKKWICVDSLESAQRERNLAHYKDIPLCDIARPGAKKVIEDNDYVIFNGDAGKISEELAESFDGCISICAFEHVHNLNQVLTSIHGALKPGARFYTEFGPIWSSYCGHHLWVGDTWNFLNTGPIPDFAHLLMSQTELFRLFLRYREPQKAEYLAYCMKASEYTNKLFYEDYEYLLEHSKFTERRLEKNISNPKPLDEKIKAELQRRYPQNKNFDVFGIRFFAQK